MEGLKTNYKTMLKDNEIMGQLIIRNRTQGLKWLHKNGLFTIGSLSKTKEKRNTARYMIGYTPEGNQMIINYNAQKALANIEIFDRKTNTRAIINPENISVNVAGQKNAFDLLYNSLPDRDKKRL